MCVDVHCQSRIGKPHAYDILSEIGDPKAVELLLPGADTNIRNKDYGAASIVLQDRTGFVGQESLLKIIHPSNDAPAQLEE